MSYIEAHKAKLKQRHYIATAQTETHWFNFYPNRLQEFRHQYGLHFCLVINCSKERDDAYILPCEEVEHCLTSESLSAGRWIGTVRRDYLSVSCGKGPAKELSVGAFHNAFELLQDAPLPLPPKPDYY